MDMVQFYVVYEIEPCRLACAQEWEQAEKYILRQVVKMKSWSLYSYSSSLTCYFRYSIICVELHVHMMLVMDVNS